MYRKINKRIGLLKWFGTILIIAIFVLMGMESPALAQKIDEKKADEIIKQAGNLWNQKNYDEAVRLLESALPEIEKELGEIHVTVGRGLNILGLCFKAKQQFKEAESSWKRALAILEKAEALEAALTLDDLAGMYGDMGRYKEAELLYKRELAIYEKEIEPENSILAKPINSLALTYYYTGRYGEAELLYKRALKIYEKALGPEHPSVATLFFNLASLYHKTGRYEEAEPLYKRSLKIFEKVPGPKHPNFAPTLNNLAELYRETGRYAEAEPLYKRALETYKKALGPEHPYVALSFNNLAELYRETSRYTEAELLFKHALKVGEKALGPEHPDVGKSLNNLALLYDDTGRYAEAEPLYKRALKIHEKALGPEHPDVGKSLNNLGVFFTKTGRYAEAEPLFNRSLEIREKALGPKHSDVAESLNNLAELYRNTSRYPEAEPLYKRALKIYEKAFGPEHPNVAPLLNNLALVYQNKGRYAEAELLFKRALKISEKSFGPEHPNVAKWLLNLAVLNVNTRKYDIAHGYFMRCLEAQILHRKRVLTGLSERHQLAFVQTQQVQTHAMLSHILKYMREDNRAVQDAMNNWLKWKGVVLETQSRYVAMVMQSQDPEIQASWKRLQEVRQYIARMIMAGPDKMKLTPATYQVRLRELANEAEELEALLSQKSAPFALEQRMGQMDVGRLARLVGTSGVYIDFAKVSMYDFLKDRSTEEHYGVFVLVPEQAGKYNLHLIDLGKAEEIDKMIQMWRKHNNAGDTEKMLRSGQELYGRIFKPIERWLKGRKRLVVCLDGELHLLPMEALAAGIDKRGKETYVMDKWEVVYVPAGRDILRWGEPGTGSRAVVVMADPDYDLGLDKRTKVITQLKLPSAAQGERPIMRGGISDDLQKIRFERLEGTQKEGRQVKRALSREGYDVKLCMGEQAIEEVLQSLSGPRLVHLATHGFFLAQEEPDLREQIQGKSRASLLGQGKDWSDMAGVVGEHPLLRSGVVLAGANSSIAKGRDEGILHGTKVQGLRLWGTDLVVLSACETGLGIVRAGEGVFGLQRSFILAGARTLIASLWKVDDDATALFMSEFYKAWTGGTNKSEALAKARRAVRNHPGHPEWSDPFYWAAFILVGAPN